MLCCPRGSQLLTRRFSVATPRIQTSTLYSSTAVKFSLLVFGWNNYVSYSYSGGFGLRNFSNGKLFYMKFFFGLLILFASLFSKGGLGVHGKKIINFLQYCCKRDCMNNAALPTVITVVKKAVQCFHT